MTRRSTGPRPAARGARLALAATIGALAGVLAERLLVRRRIRPGPPREVPLGAISGVRSHIAGPDGVQIAVETYGPEGAPQLVLAHGWMCTGRIWHEQVLRLADRWRVITYDQPGHGDSTPPRSGRYHLDLLGDTLTRVIEHATAPRPVVVMGHSLGAMGLLNAVRRASPALAQRLAGVVLLSTTSTPTVQGSIRQAGIWIVARAERMIERLVRLIRRPRVVRVADRLTTHPSDAAYLVTRWLGVGRNPDWDVVAFTLRQVLDSDSDIVPGYAVAIAGVAENAGLDALAGIPVTVVGGTRDRLTPVAFSRQMAAALRDRAAGVDGAAGAVGADGARGAGGVDVTDGADGQPGLIELVELSGVGHMSLLEAPDAVAAIAEGHLRTITQMTDREAD